MYICKNFFKTFLIISIYFSEILSQNTNINHIIQKIKHTPFVNSMSHYVLNHEIGHAYIALKNNVHVSHIAVNVDSGYVKRAAAKGIIDFEIISGGMAVELFLGENLLRMNQDDGDKLYKGFKNCFFNLKDDKLTINIGLQRFSYIIKNDIVFSGFFSFLSKEKKYIIVRKFIEGVKNKYFANDKLDKELFFGLQNKVINNNYSINSSIIYDNSFIDCTVNKNDRDVFKAIYFAKKYFTNYYNDNCNLSNEEKICIEQALKEDIAANPFYYSQPLIEDNLVISVVFFVFFIIIAYLCFADCA